MNIKDISVFGLGKLGSPLAISLAARGFSVTGVDADPAKVEAVNQGRAPVLEPGLEDLLETVGDRLAATLDGVKAVLESDVTFMVVPTPSQATGAFSIEHVLSACETIAEGIARKDSFHLVVLTSTVMPGDTGGPVREALEKGSQKRCGIDFGLCYSPEFIALGTVLRDLMNPDFVLIGESDKRSGDLLEEVYGALCENDPPFARMNFVNAELAKLSVNTFITTKISFANMLAHVCERLPGSDVGIVTSAIGLDSRIGKKYLKGGAAYGGPCFPRDNRALVTLAHAVGAPALIAEATDETNSLEPGLLAERVIGYLPEGGTVGILGFSYKPNTDVVEKSLGLLLAERLTSHHIKVVGHDPAGMENARVVLGDSVRFVESLAECIELSDVIVITTPWGAFRGLDVTIEHGSKRPKAVIDCWDILDAERVSSLAEYVSTGTGPQA